MDLQEFQYEQSHLVIFVNTDPVTGIKYIPFANVVRAFPSVNRAFLDDRPIPFLTNPTGAPFEPKRLPYIPNKVIQLSSTSSTSFNPVNHQSHQSSSNTSIESGDSYRNFHHYQQESLAQMEPMLDNPRRFTKRSSRKPQNPADLYSTVNRALAPLSIRLPLFTFIWILAMTAQLAGLSGIVDNHIGESDRLKQRIAYWATVCTILYGASLFFLAQWFTKDIVWHWHTNHVRELWGLQPSLASFSIGLIHIRMPLMIIFTLCLTLMSATSMMTNFWLTSSTRILAFTELGPPQEIMLMDIPTATEDISFASTGGVIFNSFVAQSGASATGSVLLTPYDNKFFWSPFLNSTFSQSYNVKDIMTVSLAPKCKLLSASDLNIIYNQTSPQGLNFNITIGNYNFTIPGGRGRYYYWSVEADSFALGPNSTEPMGVNVYNVMARQTMDFGPPSFTFTNMTRPSFVYATNCTLDFEWWNVTGTIHSLAAMRLEIDSATRTPARPGLRPLFASIYYSGLEGFTHSDQGRFDNTGYNLKSPLWMWMMGQGYALRKKTSNGEVIENIIHPNISNAEWVGQKLVEIAGRTMTINTAAVLPRAYMGQEVLQTSVIHANKGRILGGIAVQSLLLWIPIAIYIYKRKAGVFYGDDISRLLAQE